MKIIITGGSGFIGQHLLKALAPHNELWVMSRTPAKTQHRLANQGIEVRGFSLEQLADLDGFDAVINLAGEPIADKRWSEKQKRKICHSRWHITETLSHWVAQCQQPPHTVLSASAIGIYGNSLDTVDEHTELSIDNRDFAQQVCQTWEYLAAPMQQHTRLAIVRIGLVLGDGGMLKKMVPAFKLGLGGKLASGKQGMSWIHINDLVGLFIHLLNDKACDGLYNGTAPQPVSNQQFTEALAHSVKRPALLPAPAPLLKLALGEMSQLLLEGQYVRPTRALESNFQFQYPSLEQALSQLLEAKGKGTLSRA